MESPGREAIIPGILEWINSFSIPQRCNELSDLKDGYIINHILSIISPHDFHTNSIVKSEIGSPRSPKLAASNLRQIAGDLERYYRGVLHRSLDLSGINFEAIGKGDDFNDIWILFEAVLGAAIFSESGASNLQVMASLSMDSQALLKALIENAMMKCTPLDEHDEGDIISSGSNSASAAAADGDGIPENQMIAIIAKLEAEKSSLTAHITNLNSENSEIRNALQDSQLKLQAFTDIDIEKLKRASKNDAETIRQLNMEIADVRRELDLTKFEFEEAKQQLVETKKEYQASADVVGKLTIDNQNLVDESEMAKDAAAKLTKAEALLEKYKTKLEKIPILERQNKELSDQLDQYIDKIPEPENSNISIQQLADQHKEKIILLERQKLEAFVAAEGMKLEVEKIKSELGNLEKQVFTLDTENFRLKKIIDNNTVAVGGGNPTNTAGNNIITDSANSLEHSSVLWNRCNFLEQELLKHHAGSSSGGNCNDGKNDLVMEKEDAIQTLKKTIIDLEIELQRVNCEKEVEAKERASAALALHQMKDAQDLLTNSNHTSKLLEEKLKEKEESINKLEQEKGKLKNVATSHFKAFKERYLKQLQDITTEKHQLEELSKSTIEKYELNEETNRRDERLILSAFYGLGVKIMDRNINSHLMETSNTDMKFLKVSK